MGQSADLNLVHAGGIREAIRNHPSTRDEGRADYLFEVVGARCIEKQSLGERRMRVGSGVEEEGPYLLGEGRAARLARDRAINSQRQERVGQEACLRGFARTLATLERDEPT